MPGESDLLGVSLGFDKNDSRKHTNKNPNSLGVISWIVTWHRYLAESETRLPSPDRCLQTISLLTFSRA
jgi:hypothetical protein